MHPAKYTIIPDVHGRSFWRDAVADIETTPVVFMGDYLDPYPQDMVLWTEAWKGLNDIIALKRKHPDRATLLLGNHDVHYLPGYPFFEQGSRYDNVHQYKIRELFQKNIDCFDIAKVIPRSDGYPFLLTHAGINKRWISEFYHVLKVENDAIRDFLLNISDGDKSPERISDLLNNALHSKEEDLKKFLMRALASIPFSRGGRGVGSCVWVDINDIKQNEEDLLEGCIQIVGHSRQDCFNQLWFNAEEPSNVFCTDYGRAFTLEAGKDPFLKFKNELKTTFTVGDLAAAPRLFVFGLWLWNLTDKAREEAEALISKVVEKGSLRVFEEGAYYVYDSLTRYFHTEGESDLPEWVIAAWQRIKPKLKTMKPEELSSVIVGRRMVDRYWLVDRNRMD